MNIRIGNGYDVHKTVIDRPLILGGVNIPCEFGLLGHSDADVLVHAIMDSILGALNKGDIGKLFPDTDDKYKNADSIKLLEQVIALLHENGWKIGNIDSIVIAQKPKLMGYIPQMKENIAKACQCDIEDISVKATTEEGLGFTGSGEGISSLAVCIIEKI